MFLLSSSDFVQNYFFQRILSGTLSECQYSLDPDQDRQSVVPDLGINCLQRLLTDDKSCSTKERYTTAGKELNMTAYKS